MAIAAFVVKLAAPSQREGPSRNDGPPWRVVLDEESVLACVEAGAVGYIHKDSRPADVAQVIPDVKQDEAKEILGALIDRADVLVQNLAPRCGHKARAWLGDVAQAQPAPYPVRHLGLWPGRPLPRQEGL